jgi:hypothetical protein
MIMHSEWPMRYIDPKLRHRAAMRRIAGRRMADAFAMARGARAQIREAQR